MCASMTPVAPIFPITAYDGFSPNDMEAANLNFAEIESERLAQIYRAAASLFCERGFDATSMNDIAEAVGVTKAALYYFVPGGKQELLFAIMNFGLDQLERYVIRPARAIPDAETRLHTIIRNHVQLITNGAVSKSSGRGNPVTIVVDETGGLTPTQRRKIDQRKREYVELLRDTLSQLQHEDKLRALDATVAAFSLLGTMLWVARWYDTQGRLNAEQITEEIVKLALGGLLRQSESIATKRKKPLQHQPPANLSNKRPPSTRSQPQR